MVSRKVDQTRFDVLQSTFEIVSSLFLDESQYRQRGRQFTMTLLVNVDNSDRSLYLDIYVNRLRAAERAVAKAIDGSKRVLATASVEPEGEAFDIEIGLSRSRDVKESRPEVRVAPEMFRILRDSQRADQSAAVAKLLADLFRGQ